MAETPPFVEGLTEHYYLFSRYLIPEDFVDRLVSENVLTLDDKEVISNQYIHQNRRQRTNKLIEILMTRGEHGYQKFLEILEYMYPQVFFKVTKQKPRKPPADFLPSRMSDKLRIIDSLPKLAQHIKEQFYMNAELDAQLTVLQQFLEVSKEENNALEQEIENMRGIRQENEQLHMKIMNLENDARENQIAINKEMQRTFAYIEARDNYQQKWESLQVQYDELYKKYRTELTARGPNVGTRQSSQAKPSHPDQDLGHSIEGERMKHYFEKCRILETDLEMNRTQCEDISNQLDIVRQNEIHLEHDLEEKKKDLTKKEREIRALEKQLLERNVKIDSFYNLICKKDTEIYELNKQRMDDQERYNEQSREKNQIFDQNYELEKQVKKLEEELLRLKARLSGSSQGEGSSANSGSDEEGNVEVYQSKLRRKQGFKCPPGGRYERGQVVYDKGQVVLRNPSLREHRALTSDTSLQDIETVLDTGKASTLPNKCDSPTEIFEREVFWLRYSLRTGSMTTQPDSYRRPEKSRVPLEASDQQFASDQKSRPLHDDDDTESQSGLKPRSSGNTAADPSPEQPQKQEPKTNIVSPLRTSVPSKISQGVKPFIKQTSVPNIDLETIQPLSSDFQSHDVYSVFLPKKCKRVIRPGMLDKDLRMVTLKFPVLGEKIEIYGGNHTGIFISKVLKNVDLSLGEEIKEVIYTPNEHVHPIVTSLKGCTLEEVHRLLSEEFIRPKKEREVRISVRKCADDHEAMKRWLAENNNTGDYFFVRCNISLDSKSEEETCLSAGDVFLVTDSLYNPEKRQWCGHKVDLFTNLVDEHTDVVIPNLQESNIRRFKSLRQNSSEDEFRHFGRMQGFKVRGQPYDRVLPMKASMKLPVHVIGPGALVNELMGQISAKLHTKFFVQKTDQSGDNFSEEMCRSNIHHVVKGKMQVLSRVSVQRIVVLIFVTQELSQEEARVVFGKSFHGSITLDMVDQCTRLRKKLKELGHSFEELHIANCHNEKMLLQEFTAKVQGSQDRVLWLCNKEMDSEIVDRYCEILGPSSEIHDLNAQLQDAQNFDATKVN